jgi:hypothetical protein
MPVRSIQARVEREYGGINSSGGPQVSGRSDQSDFVVELSAGKFSPFLYEHCCGGMQLKWVHLAVLQWDDASSSAQLWQHIRMEDVNLTGYKIRGTRFFTQEFTADEVNPLLKAKTFVKYQDYDVSDVGHIDRMTLLYTSISFTVFDSAGALASQNGWTTGSDEPWMSSAAAPAAAPASANP